MDNGNREPGKNTGAKQGRSLADVLESGRLYLEERAFVTVGRFHSTRRKRQAPEKPPPKPDHPPSADIPKAASLSVTEAALKSIIEVRRPIRPEFSFASLRLLVPVMVICLLLIAAAVNPFAQILLHEATGFDAAPNYTSPTGLGLPYSGGGTP